MSNWAYWRCAEPGDRALAWDWQYQLHGPVRLLGPVFTLLGGRWEGRSWERLRDLMQSEKS